MLSPLWLFHPATVAALAHLDRRLAGLGLPSVALTCFGLQPLVWLALCRELCRRYGTARILPGRLHFGHPALGTTRWVERDEVVSHRETPWGIEVTTRTPGLVWVRPLLIPCGRDPAEHDRLQVLLEQFYEVEPGDGLESP